MVRICDILERSIPSSFTPLKALAMFNCIARQKSTSEPGVKALGLSRISSSSHKNYETIGSTAIDKCYFLMYLMFSFYIKLKSCFFAKPTRLDEGPVMNERVIALPTPVLRYLNEINNIRNIYIIE